MPSTIQSFFATIDSGSPPPSQPWDSAFRQNRSHRDETFKLKLLRWRRRVLPPGLPAVHSKFQRHRLATSAPYPRSMAKDRPLSHDQAARMLERAKGIEPSYAAWEAAVLPLNYARGRLRIPSIAGRLVLSLFHTVPPEANPPGIRPRLHR